MEDKDLKGKFIIAWDTICDGEQCATDDDGMPNPELFDSEADAHVEIFEDAYFMLDNRTDEDRKEDGVSKKKFAAMKKIYNNGDGDAEQMKNFLDANPECNYFDEFVVPAEEFIFGRKAFFTGNGGHIEGTKL